MTVRTTLSFTDRHHAFLSEKVGQGVFASTSAAVAAAIEQLIEDEAARETALAAMAEEIRRRVNEPDPAWTDIDTALEAATRILER